MSIDPHLMKDAIAEAKDFDLPEGWHQIHTVGVNQRGELLVKTFIFETGEAPLIANGGDWQWDWKSRPVNSRGQIDYSYVDDETGEIEEDLIERVWDGG